LNSADKLHGKGLICTN